MIDPYDRKEPDCSSLNKNNGFSARIKHRFPFSDPDNSIPSIDELSNGDIELKGLLPGNSALPEDEEDEEDEEFELTVHGLNT